MTRPTCVPDEIRVWWYYVETGWVRVFMMPDGRVGSQYYPYPQSSSL
jgi:hypothetical protein